MAGIGIGTGKRSYSLPFGDIQEGGQAMPDGTPRQHGRWNRFAAVTSFYVVKTHLIFSGVS